MQHYDTKYHEWQKRIGRFGGHANLFKFLPFLQPDDVVLDFGSGGGYLLENLPQAQKAGLEINTAAREDALARGLTIFAQLDDVPDQFASVVISNHVLEHVESPLDELRRLKPKVRPGGRLIFVVPHQKPEEAYHEKDINMHLYTWNPMTLGNLFKAAGYEVVRVDVIQHRWPPRFIGIYQRFGERLFHVICRLYAVMTRNYQIRIVARRPSE